MESCTHCFCHGNRLVAPLQEFRYFFNEGDEGLRGERGAEAEHGDIVGRVHKIEMAVAQDGIRQIVGQMFLYYMHIGVRVRTQGCVGALLA